jgi:type II secretory pathway pseudopilin PulG
MFFPQDSRFKIQDSISGFTLIESLVFLFIFSVVSVVFLQTYVVGTRLIIESKNRLGAVALANQKMEIVRSVDYTAVGTKHWNGNAWVYGIPAGDILENEIINVNTMGYSVDTDIRYVDDAFDGVSGGSPNDTVPNDYKRVKISVSWGTQGADQSVTLTSDVAPVGLETSASGGVLSINILDLPGTGVPGATVRIVNASAGVDTTTQTDAMGNITLPGAPVGDKKYALTISKSDYYGAVTYPPYPTSSFNPVDLHASVVANTLNPEVVRIDRAADIEIDTEDPFGTAVPNISFSITGGRIIGYVPNTNPVQPVYGFTQNTSTDAFGQKTFADQSFGTYTVTVSGSGHTFYKISPESSVANGLDVSPGESFQARVILLDNAIGSVFSKVTDKTDGSAVEGASVQLTNAAAGYDTTQTTDKFGFAYFPTALPGLIAGTYTLQVSKSGFTTKSETFSVGSALTTQTIQLEH